MYICFHDKYILESDELNNEIERAISENRFIYYNYNKEYFADYNDQKVDLQGKEVIPNTDIDHLEDLITKLTAEGAIIPNSLSNINNILRWYKFISPKRIYLSFTGEMLKDKDFLTYLFQTFNKDSEVFLKTVTKDFNGIVALADFFNENSDLRKAFSYHDSTEFIVSPKVNIDYDELGKIEYRAFIHNRKVLNISRITDEVYHRIPEKVLDFIESTIKLLPDNFPNSFVLDVFSYNGILDILEFNPIEDSGKYLYNSIFENSTDLLHENIENIPCEKDKTKVGYEAKEALAPSTTINRVGSFAKDYSDVQKFGERVNGYVYFSGSSEGKIDINSILTRKFDLITDEDFF